MQEKDARPIDNIINIRVKAIKLIFSLFTLIAATAMLFYMYFIFVQGIQLAGTSSGIFFTITVLVLIALLIVRRTVNLKNYKIFFVIIVAILSVVTLFISLRSGVYSTMNLLILVTLVTVLMIVSNWRIARIFTLSLLGVLSIIAVLQTRGDIPLVPDITGSDIDDVTIAFLFVWIIVELAKLGFNQIEHYYQNAYSYAKELEELNRDLDKKVKERTAMLQDNFNNQIRDMYNSATIGNITKPLLHDLATPISVILGSTDLITKTKKYDTKLLDIVKTSADQMRAMIDESKDLMRNKDITEIFNAIEHINKAIKIIRNELNKNEIELEYQESEPLFIEGIVSIFERMIINLIVNAMEELKTKKDNRKIRIEIKQEAEFIFVTITDNGRGIKRELIEKIFMEDFSIKHTTHNLGLGLPFVKKMMNQVFKGEILCDSIVGEYTSFILRFNIYRNGG